MQLPGRWAWPNAFHASVSCVAFAAMRPGAASSTMNAYQAPRKARRKQSGELDAGYGRQEYFIRSTADPDVLLLPEIYGFHGVKGNRVKTSAIRNAAGLTIILSLFGPAHVASAAPSLAADAIASGVITNAHGQVDPSGEVYVFALPDQSKMIGAPTGKPIPITLVGYARTNTQGLYAVNARPASLMTTNGRHGYVNLQVIAVSGGKSAVANYSVMPAGAAWRVEGGTNAVPALSFNFATRLATPPPVATMVGASSVAAPRIQITPTAVTVALERLRKATHFASAPSPASSNPHASPSGSYCFPTAGAFHRKRPEHFVTTATTSTGGKIPETVEEAVDKSTTHTLGIAAKGDVKGSEWHGDGTGSVTDSTSSSVSETFSASRTVFNLVNYRDYHYACGALTEREPYSIFDLLTSDYGGKTPMTWLFNCDGHNPGTQWSTSNATSATFGGGVSLGPISVSAQSGYGTSVKLTFHYHVAGEICGNNPDGPAQSSRVEADSGSG